MRVLITGADSFIGKNFFKYSKYKQVDEVSLFDTKPEDIDFSPYDVVFHLVAIVHQSSHIPEDQYYRINRDLTLAVAKNAKKSGIKQFIFLSTIKVYGEYIPGSGAWDENSACNPSDFYGKSKYEAEINLRELNTKDFTVSIVRTPLVYGSGVRANMAKIISLVRRYPILPLGGIQNNRRFTYVENLVALIDRLIESRKPGIFIAMDEKALSTTELVKIIAEALKKRQMLFKLPDFFVRAGNTMFPHIFDRLFGSFELNNEHTKRVLDFHTTFTTREGIEKTICQMTAN